MQITSRECQLVLCQHAPPVTVRKVAIYPADALELRMGTGHVRPVAVHGRAGRDRGQLRHRPLHRRDGHLDDTSVTIDGQVIEESGFEDGLAPWAIAPPPEGNSDTGAAWQHSQSLVQPRAAAVTTEDTVSPTGGSGWTVDVTVDRPVPLQPRMQLQQEHPCSHCVGTSEVALPSASARVVSCCILDTMLTPRLGLVDHVVAGVPDDGLAAVCPGQPSHCTSSRCTSWRSSSITR